MNRNQIFNALFALVSQGEGQPGLASINWPGGQGFQFTSRRIRMFDNLPGKPALCQAEFGENVRKASRDMPYRWELMAEWWVYHEAGEDADSTPTTLTNDILDALELAIAPPPYEVNNRNTLGGLIFDCYLDGTVMKTSGDLEGQALISVPIKLLIP
jgi:hypothetical protein